MGYHRPVRRVLVSLSVILVHAAMLSAAAPGQRLAVVTAGTPLPAAARILRAVGPGRLLVVGQGSAAAVEPWRPESALSPPLAGDRLPAGRHRLVAVTAGEAAELAAALEAAGARLRWVERVDGLAELGIELAAEAWPAVRAALLADAGLVSADAVGGARLLNAASAWRCQSGRPGVTPLFEAGLLGQGQVIGIVDTGIDADHCFFADPEGDPPALNGADGLAVSAVHRKLAAVDFLWSADWPDPGPERWDDHGHGTHVAGSAAGDGGVRGVHDGDDGMAPLARLVIQDAGALVDDCADLPGLGCPVRPLEPVLEQAYAQGARVFSNSWGDEENILPYGRYTERTVDVDRFVWEHPDAVVLFAAGNSGPGDGTVLSPATGKNVIAVGATEHGDADPLCPAWFSSRGPTLDGRLEPDVMAPGYGVVSAKSDGLVLGFAPDDCGEVAASGTSMATPTAAGLAALVRQYFQEGRYPDGAPRPARAFTPSAALVKAVLVASAVDLAELGCGDVRPVPSPDQGWGVVQLDRALPLPDSGRGLVVADGPVAFTAAAPPAWSLEVVVPESGELKVVLVWTDPPSTPSAAVHLVNDLDLVVSGPDGTFLGNVFSDGESVAGGSADRRNTVEVVRRRAASPGRWRIVVRAAGLTLPPQAFALAVVGSVRPAASRRPGGRAGRPAAGVAGSGVPSLEVRAP